MGTPWNVYLGRMRTLQHDFSIQTKMLFGHQYLYLKNKGESEFFDQTARIIFPPWRNDFSRLASHEGSRNTITI